MNDFGVWTKMTPRSALARMVVVRVVRSFVFINDGRREKEEGGKTKERERLAGSTDVLHCGR